MSEALIQQQHLKPLADELERLFDGDYMAAARKMDEVMFMLFFVTPDEFDHRQIQTTAYQLHALSTALKQCANLSLKS